jgi:hypothetical protein
MCSSTGEQLVAANPNGASFVLNDVAATVWRRLEQPASFDDLRDALLGEYEVGADECRRDLETLLADLMHSGLVERRSHQPSAPRPGSSRRHIGGSRPRGKEAREAKRRPLVVPEELSLIVECCRSTFMRLDPVTAGLRTDWPLFLRLARFHRVQGLVSPSLNSLGHAVPEPIAVAISDDAAAIAADNLRAAIASRELLAGFEQAGLPVLFVKGLTLGALAYGNPALKAGIDIDLLVPPERIDDAAAVLGDLGFARTIPRPRGSPAELRRWHGRRKESLWQRSEPEASVDLHTRLADSPFFIPAIDADSPAQWVDIGNGIRLPTLHLEPLFAYLCVHGAWSAWFRLKWITDLAALLHGRSAEEIERLYDCAAELRAGRAPAQALLLADALFGTLDGAPALREKLERSRANRWLVKAALRQLGRRRGMLEPTQRRFGTLPIHLAELFLAPGLRFKLSEAVRQARAALG